MARVVMFFFAVATVFAAFWLYGVGFLRRFRGKKAAIVRHASGAGKTLGDKSRVG